MVLPSFAAISNFNTERNQDHANSSLSTQLIRHILNEIVYTSIVLIYGFIYVVINPVVRIDFFDVF